MNNANEQEKKTEPHVNHDEEENEKECTLRAPCTGNTGKQSGKNTRTE